MNRFAPLALLFFAVPLAHAQGVAFDLDGQIRHRSELDGRDVADGDVASPSNPLLFHLLRSRLGVAVRPVEDVRVYVQVQDGRFFGEERPALGRGTLDGSADGLDLHQAYLAVDDLFDSGLGLALGRQELAYGNERLVGAVGWSNTGRSFDAAVLRLRDDRVAADLFAAQLASPAVYEGAQHFAGLYTTWTLADDHALDAFALLDTDHRELVAGPDDGEPRLTRVTPGLRAHGAPGAFDYDVELIGQFGRIAPADDAERQGIGAYLASAAAGYAIAPGVRLGAGYTRLSGDGDPDDDTFRTFNTLFATNHKFYGFMDYFPPLAGPYGLQDAFVSLGASATERLRLALDLHHFAAAVEPAGGRGVFGQEVDLTANYRYNGALGFQAGASAFFPGSFTEAAVGDATTYWLYLQTTATF